MTIRPTRLATQLGLAFGSLVLMHSGAFAQTLERVEITGSNIRRAQAETAAPVQTVTREEIDRSGKASVAELLQTLAIDNQGSVPTTFGNGFAPGASGISLRGLGAASTLVLINGRRVAPYGLADDGQKVFVDLNVIPLEAVERVEILKDGASAIYGSDAIGGVVNIILKRDFKGTVAKASYGTSRYGDGTEKRASITHGFGDLSSDKYNFLINFEVARKGEINARDRADRKQIGRIDLRDIGFDSNVTTGGGAPAGGTGTIIADRGAAVSSIIGNVRNPADLSYWSRDSLDPTNGFTRTFPGAACANLTSHPQGDPLGGCLTDATQEYTQIQPSQQSTNLFGRGTFDLSGGMQVYVEGNYYTNKSKSIGTPSGVNGNVGYPGGPVNNGVVTLGADHPDNPYFGTAARLRYLAADVGPRVSDVDSTTTRLVAGLKGTVATWDYDTAFIFSENKVSNVRSGFLQRDVAFALLNPSGANNRVAGQTNAQVAASNAAYAALPAGTFWRIGENAGLNSAALYSALAPKISNDAISRVEQVDFKASSELGQLEGGAIGVALGAELRRESLSLEPTTGTDKGNIIGLGYSAYKGSRNVYAFYGEVLAPVFKTLELSAALRADKYTNIDNSITPKIGAKWTPTKELAVRGTYGQGFRAPSAAENGEGGLAFFTTQSDPVRCAAAPTNSVLCGTFNIAGITSPNPALVPEKSKSYTLGTVWDPASKTSIAVDYWEIHRSNEINQELTSAAILAGKVIRDPTTALPTVPGDPGGIVAVLVNYVNSAKTKVRGLDMDLQQGFDLGGGSGKLTLDAKWTHLFSWQRTEQDGTRIEFAGTHGNCDVTNCIGTPSDRLNLGATWQTEGFKLAAVVNWRGSLDNRFAKGDADCATTFADGTDAPEGCKIKAFTTVDLSARYNVTKNFELFGSIQNLFDAVAPLDPTTYGTNSYNPLDTSGAVGRYFTAGLKYKF